MLKPSRARYFIVVRDKARAASSLEKLKPYYFEKSG